jgi:hypothetical protein
LQWWKWSEVILAMAGHGGVELRGVDWWENSRELFRCHAGTGDFPGKGLLRGKIILLKVILLQVL